MFLACLVPLGRLAWKAYNSALGANPIQVITWSTGTWTLVFLMVTLSVTPLRKLTKQYWLIQFRRMLGLFAFFYGCLHFTDIHLARPVLRLAEHHQRRCETPIHHGRLHRFRADDPAGTDLDPALYPLVGQEMAGAPPVDLRNCNRWSHSLHLAGEERPSQAAHLRRHPRRATCCTGSSVWAIGRFSPASRRTLKASALRHHTAVAD